jgi:hypothetical protein
MATKKEFYAYALGIFMGELWACTTTCLMGSLKRTCLSKATTLA